MAVRNCLLSSSTVAHATIMEMTVEHIEAEKNSRHFPDDIFKCIFFNENVWISPQISLKFVPRGPINNIPSLGKIMAWRRPGDKPLSDPMMVSVLTHIYVTRPQWVNALYVWLRKICTLRHPHGHTDNWIWYSLSLMFLFIIISLVHE